MHWCRLVIVREDICYLSAGFREEKYAQITNMHMQSDHNSRYFSLVDMNNNQLSFKNSYPLKISAVPNYASFSKVAILFNQSVMCWEKI